MRICVFVLLGAVVSYAVAWGSVWRADQATWNSIEEQHWDGDFQTEAPTWQPALLVERGVLTSSDVDGFYEPAFAPGFRHDVFTLFNRSMTVGQEHLLFGDVNNDMTHLIRLSAGFPMYCCEGWLLAADIGGNPVAQLRGVWMHGRLTSPEAFLPWLPRWPGFLLNSLFYAAILWLVWFTPGATRRAHRHRRGQCTACAYPLGEGEVCSECGVTRAVKRSSDTREHSAR